MGKIILAALLSVILSACQTAQPLATASGKPETTIHAPVQKVKSAIVSLAMNHGFNVSKDTDFVLQVEKPTDNFGIALLMGSRYDGTPAERVTFTFAPMGEDVRVTAAVSIVTNPGSAFERPAPVNTGEPVEKMQKILLDIKAQAEVAPTPQAPAKKPRQVS